MNGRRGQDGVLLVGTFPPPIDGMSVVNIAIQDALERRGVRLTIVDSSGKGFGGVLYHARRLVAHLRAILIMLDPRRVVNGTLCHGVNAGLSMPYTLAIVAVARMVGMEIMLYYHSSNYIIRRSRLLSWIVRIAGPNCLHTLASEEMVQKFRANYLGARFRVVDNCAYVTETAPSRERMREPVRMGLLSNLTIEKGLGLAIDTAKELRARGTDARLILAGPLVGADAEAAATAARHDLAGAVEFRGTVLGDAKTRFFEDIDVFLFPSLYAHETQSIVVPEAMAAGMPILVHDHNFIRDLLANSGIDHLLLPADGGFAKRAADVIVAWREDPVRYAADARCCRMRFDALRERGRDQFERLIGELAPTSRRRLSSVEVQARSAHGHD